MISLSGTIDIGERDGIERCTEFQISEIKINYNIPCHTVEGSGLVIDYPDFEGHTGEYDPAQACVAEYSATALYTNTNDDNVAFEWSVESITPGANVTIVGESDKDTVMVWVESAVEYTSSRLTCKATYLTTSAVSTVSIEVETNHGSK